MSSEVTGRWLETRRSDALQEREPIGCDPKSPVVFSCAVAAAAVLFHAGPMAFVGAIVAGAVYYAVIRVMIRGMCQEVRDAVNQVGRIVLPHPSDDRWERTADGLSLGDVLVQPPGMLIDGRIQWRCEHGHEYHKCASPHGRKRMLGIPPVRKLLSRPPLVLVGGIPIKAPSYGREVVRAFQDRKAMGSILGEDDV